jgi:hypothetical protein
MYKIISQTPSTQHVQQTCCVDGFWLIILYICNTQQDAHYEDRNRNIKIVETKLMTGHDLEPVSSSIYHYTQLQIIITH